MPKPKKQLIKSFDTEATGLDLRHGAKPFLVTLFYDGSNVFYEWDVDPLTREVLVDPNDLVEIQQEIDTADLLILQNPKFDKIAMDTIDPDLVWDWSKVRDTLRAGHLLASNQPHDLTSMVLIYLGINVQPFEDRIEKATKAARNLCRTKAFIAKHGQWMIAKEDLPCMPSAGEETWKYDMWLPRAVAKAESYPLDHEWWRVCSEYANSDSAGTLPLYLRQLEIIKERGLLEIYLECLKSTYVACETEKYGVTLSGERMEELEDEYQEESDKADRVCVNIANDFGAELTLPKSGNNKSLTSFVFDVMKLPAIKTSRKTGAPSLDKNVLEHYEATLPYNSKSLTFVRNLRGKRSRDTALTYMKSYRRYWIPLGQTRLNPETGQREHLWYRLHPSLNSTGTDTLRWSSSNPNEQNISKKEGFNLRYMFGPAPGREWWSCDAKNIELRLPAYEANEAELIDIFERPDDPPYYGSVHLLNFSTVYPDIWDKALRKVGFDKVGPYCKDEYESTWYQWCKNGDFAVQYGAIEREKGTADRAFHRDGSHALLKARFAKLDELNQLCIRFAEEHGYVETFPDKTVNPLHGYPLLCSRTSWGGILPTVPLNYHVQGTAMWWMMRAMVLVQEQLDDWNSSGFDGHIVMQVHDELVFDFPKAGHPVKQPKQSNLHRVRRLQSIMSAIGSDLVPCVPTPVSCEYHEHNWAEGSVI